MWEGPRVELPGGLHTCGRVWCDLSGVEGEIGEALLCFQGQGCADQGLEVAGGVLAGGLEWETMDPNSFGTAGNCTGVKNTPALDFGNELMSFPNCNCFSGLAWVVQCPVFLNKGFGSCFLSSLNGINAGSFTGHMAVHGLRALPGGDEGK